ncbi:hypothetical protein [Muricoccus radiodurans]|uniref:O-linked N-acetylglucosamine transferase, SPINDLY family protein n=1 Tax=Muricoccus radiodurans TaxID=2231721 RepID=UPI003CF81DD1
MSQIHLDRADRLHLDGKLAEAVHAYREAVSADRSSFDAWSGLGHAAAALLEYGEAIPALREALNLRPGEARLRVNLAKALFAIGYVSEAMRENERAIREGDAAARAAAVANAAIMAPGDPELDHAAVLHSRARWAAAEAASVTPLRAAPAPGPRLRIAYYGSFFDRPNWMKMYMGVINAHDRDRFEVNLICDGAAPCAEAGYRDHDNDRIWEVTGMLNADLARHVAEAGIDVLVDLNGYSHPARLPLLLHRAAPVQIAWNGMYGTTGFPHLNALVGDARSILPEEERFCSEPILRVAQTYLPFTFFYEAPPVAPPPMLREGQVTFGSLNSAYKLTPKTLSVWSSILRAVPGSRLLLRNRGLDAASNRADLLSRFAAGGILPNRLTLEGGGTHDEFLRTYDRVDLALDTFPYNGGTTTAEALWQGVPVLTTVGDRWAGRTSRSLLVAAGYEEDVAADEDALVALAVRLAASPQHLARRRAGQRAAVAASPACDPAGLCRELEEIYRRTAEAAFRRRAAAPA